jgi:hypothetical protein
MTVLPQSRVRARAQSRRLAGSHSRIVAVWEVSPRVLLCAGSGSPGLGPKNGAMSSGQAESSMPSGWLRR